MQNAGACKVCARQVGGKQISVCEAESGRKGKYESSFVGISTVTFMSACSVNRVYRHIVCVECHWERIRACVASEYGRVAA